jgi:hypothetical protein
MTIKGFDTRANCTQAAAAIKAAGYDFVGRYLGRNSDKVIGSAEAEALRAAGLAIVLVYEDVPTAAGYFTPDRGTSDGLRAVHQANLILPASVGKIEPAPTIYFAVDYNAAEADLAAAIIPYFQAIENCFGTAAALTTRQYRVGVYGSGMVCTQLAKEGLAYQGWLSCSKGWRGYKDYTKDPPKDTTKDYTTWSIRQSLPTTFEGLSVDPDIAQGEDYGAIRP